MTILHSVESYRPVHPSGSRCESVPPVRHLIPVNHRDTVTPNGISRDAFFPPRRAFGVRLVHERGNDRETLASDVERAESRLAQARGLMFRRSVAEKYALVFPFGSVGTRSLHMLFVPFAIDAVWLVDGEVTKVKRLRAWTGIGWGRADCVVELPAGAASDVEPGDELRLEDD